MSGRAGKGKGGRDYWADVNTLDGEFQITGSGSGGQKQRPIDVLVGTPTKLLEMARGRGWNWEERELQKRALEGGDLSGEVKKFWVDKPEVGLEGVEWVVVDEADVLLGGFWVVINH